MSNNSMIAKSVILVSALIGGVVGIFELSDRLAVSTETGGATVNQSAGTGGAIQQAGSSEVETSETRERVAGLPSTAAESALERELALRVAEQLARFDCADVEVERVTATATIVPDNETSHGFEGHTLEGAVVLQGNGGSERLRLAGSGKGPTGATGAVDMALRGFDEHVQGTGIFKANCKGD